MKNQTELGHLGEEAHGYYEAVDKDALWVITFYLFLYYSLLSKPDKVGCLLLAIWSEKLYLESLRILQVAMGAAQKNEYQQPANRQDSK